MTAIGGTAWLVRLITPLTRDQREHESRALDRFDVTANTLAAALLRGCD